MIGCRLDLDAAVTNLPAAALPASGTLREADVPIRPATAAEAHHLYRLITANLEAGYLLPRSLEDLTAHAPRFLVATQGAEVVGCGELAPLSHAVAEIRSLVVHEPYRGSGVGTRLVRALARQAQLDGFPTLCAFTHEPTRFVHLGFSIVPHVWLPAKISTDCCSCTRFRRCTQYAMVLELAHARGPATGAGRYQNRRPDTRDGVTEVSPLPR